MGRGSDCSVFPQSMFTEGSVVGDFREPGMSLRDWFAGQALIGLISSVEIRFPKIEGYASRAYEVADAMLNERAKLIT